MTIENDRPFRITPDTVDDDEIREAANRKIRFIGQPILRPPPGTRDTTVPSRWRGHPLVRDRYFFTLPRAIIDELHRQINADPFDAELADLEYELAEVCGDHSINVGFRANLPIEYNVLRHVPLREISAEDAAAVGWDITKARLDEVRRIYEERSGQFAIVARGYVGWLMTNKQFLDEHDALLANWSDLVQRWGLNNVGLLIPEGMLRPEEDPTRDPRWQEFDTVLDEFFVRWRLQGLAAPYLPVPLRPLMAGNFPISIVRQIARAGGVFMLPDTFPIPSREQLRGLLGDVLSHREDDEHLAEWKEVIRRDNPAKNPIVRYARLFELQHYWRILMSRHPNAFARKLTVVKRVLGQFFGTAEQTIHQDLVFIRKRLGTEWVHRQPPGPFGPF